MSNLLITVQTISCSITLIYGSFMFFWFLFGHHNYDSSIWALILALSSASIVHINILIFRNKLYDWYERKSFKVFIIFGSLLTVVAIIASIIYIALGIHGKQKFDLQSYFATGLLALMSLKGSLSLIFASRKYIKQLEENNS